MSHELRTPLNAILGFAQLLEFDAQTEDERESVEQILRAGRHLLHLVDEVLDLARIEASRVSLSIEPVLLGEVITQSVDLIRPLAAQRRISITWDAGADHPSVRADAQRLKQVLINLLSNAVKYNHVGGGVEVAIAPVADGMCRIEVRDTGWGLSVEEQAKLFTPFERLKAATTGVVGTGLGLALSKGLVDAMGGGIGVASEVGEGSTFWIELPWAAHAREETVPDPIPLAEPGSSSDRSYTVLYIEDNVSNLRLIERILSRRPEIGILAAMQGGLGVDLAREHHPDLILLDLNLPDMSGEEVLRRIRELPELRDVPLIAVSADATERQKERLLAAGVRAYLTKPIDVAEFLRALDRHLPTDGGADAPA